MAINNNTDLRCVDGQTLSFPPWKSGDTNWGNMKLPDVFVEDSTQQYPIGTRIVKGDRSYRYCYAASALLRGMGAHDAGVVGLHTLAVSGGQAAGAAYLTIPDTDTDHVANWWAGGYVAMEGWGPWTRSIMTSTASDGSTVNLTLETTLPTAVTTNKVQVVRSPYAQVTAGGTLGAATAKITAYCCVPGVAITSGYYFWGQTWGPVGGCPAAFFGDLEYEKTTVFHDTDGSVRESSSLITNNKHYQEAGYVLGRYTAATDHRIPIYQLMLAP